MPIEKAAILLILCAYTVFAEDSNGICPKIKSTEVKKTFKEVVGYY